MNIAVFDTDSSVRDIFSSVLQGHNLVFIDGPMNKENVAKCADCEVASIFVSSGCAREWMDAMPKLKLIAARSTGIDHIDTACAKEKGISIANVPRYGQHTVAEFAFALILALSRRICDASKQVREKGLFSTAGFEGFDLFGKTMGVLGTGAIGRSVVQIARGFGMRVLMMDKFPDAKLEDEHTKYVPLEQLYAESDIISVHVPFFPENYHLVGRDAFSKMKKGVLLINTARGDLVDTEALIDALKDGTVAGAGLDVLEGERALKDEIGLLKDTTSSDELKRDVRNHMLMEMPQVIITPHIAFYSREAYHEILSVSAENVKNFAEGKPSNVVSL